MISVAFMGFKVIQGIFLSMICGNSNVYFTVFVFSVIKWVLAGFSMVFQFVFVIFEWV